MNTFLLQDGYDIKQLMTFDKPFIPTPPDESIDYKFFYIFIELNESNPDKLNGIQALNQMFWEERGQAILDYFYVKLVGSSSVVKTKYGNLEVDFEIDQISDAKSRQLLQILTSEFHKFLKDAGFPFHGCNGRFEAEVEITGEPSNSGFDLDLE